MTQYRDTWNLLKGAMMSKDEIEKLENRMMIGEGLEVFDEAINVADFLWFAVDKVCTTEEIAKLYYGPQLNKILNQRYTLDDLAYTYELWSDMRGNDPKSIRGVQAYMDYYSICGWTN